MKYFSIIGASLLGCTLHLSAQNSSSATDSTTMQLKLNEVVIKSGKETTEQLLKMPVATTFISATTVEAKGMTSLKDAVGLVPNLFMPDFGSKLTSPIYIRGVGSKINVPSVGLYVDDVPYFEKAAFDFELADIERIEVLRGPQGTLYGRNTMGGIINVYTKNGAGSQPSAKLMLTGGNFGLKRTQASVYAPITQKSSVMVSGFYTERDGYFTNEFNGKKVDDETNFGGHIKYRFELGKHLQLTLMSAVERMNQGGYPYANFVDSSRVTKPINYDHESGYDRDMWSNAVTLTYRTDKSLLRWVTSHQYLSDNQDIDQDFTAANTYAVTQSMKQNVLSQEIIFKHRFNDHINWLAGLWGFKQWSNSQLDLTTKGVHSYTKYFDNPTYGAAAFSEITISDIPKGLSFTAGLRYDTEESGLDYLYNRTVNNAPVLAQQFNHYLSFSQLLPKVAISYMISNHVSTYATVTKGYKTGGFNSSFERSQDEAFLPEYSWNYEVGAKGNLLDDALQAGICAFYIDWKDQQITQPVYPSKKGTMLKNAGESNSKGIEIELNAKPVEGLNIGVSYGLTEARFDKYLRDTVNVDPTKNINYNNNYFPLVPQNTFMASASYHLPLTGTYFKGIDFHANYQGVGRIYWNEDNSGYQNFYGIVNGKVSLQIPHVRVELWGKNLFETNYHSYYFQTAGQSYVQVGKPRTMGVNLIFNI